MNIRQLIALPSRPSLALRTRLQILPTLGQRLRQAHVHASPRPCFPSPGVMLGRAKKSFEASQPAAQPTNPVLKKELFPSSSPTFRDGTISDFTKKNRSSNSSSASANASTNARASAGWGSAKAAGFPLKPTSDNVVQRRPHTSSITSFAKPTSGFSSLYSQPDPFKDEPVSSTAGGSTTKTTTSVYIAEDDFSDDDALELDYECPASLPPPPPLPRQHVGKQSSIISIPDTPPAPFYAPSPATSTQAMPWTSSPIEHLFPPPLPRQLSVKRQSPHDVKPAAIPVAKKRKLPASWSRPVKEELNIEEDEDVDLFDAHQSSYRSAKNAAVKKERSVKKEKDDGDLFAAFKASAATPAAKSKSSLPWDATHSAYKARKNQLKSQSKAKSESQNDLSFEDIKAATETHHKVTHAAMSLSVEQQHVQELVVEKKQSCFFTGPAGTGKSVLMRSIIAALKKKWARDPERLSITASTGLAACNIGGMTLHSFAGIGLGKEDVPTLVKKIRRNPKAKNRWLRTSVLIIDEVSMVDGELFDKLQQIARTIRNNGRPWGGIQLVITGDFFQLPPVPDRNKRETKFAFDAATWSTSIDHTIGLTQVFRQRDHHFAGMLNEMRLGRVSEDTVQTFKNLSRPIVYGDGLDATELFPTRQEVERSNEMRLRALPGEVRSFLADDSGDPNVRDKLLENMMAPKSIELKKGAQVMLIKNLDDTLVNGSLGKVVGFTSEAFFEANAHKMFDHDETDTANDAEVEVAKKKIKSFTRESALKDLKEYPVVQFNATDGGHRILHIMPEEWKVELPNGDVQAKRTALPLILAWALSIHKAQGQTLERVKVDLGKVFEKGQAYVALSRATCKEGLQVLRFDKSKVMAHPRVIQFYNQLYSAEVALKKKAPATISDFAKVKKETSVRKVDVIDLDEDEEEAMAAYG